VVLVLLEHEADVEGVNRMGQTGLMIAAMKGSDKLVGLLLSSGADINRQDCKGNTALHYSIIWNNYKVMEYLLARNDINVDICNNDNLVPFNLASSSFTV